MRLPRGSGSFGIPYFKRFGSAFMPHPQLLVEDHPAGYRWLRLDRPERRNALDPGLMAAVRDALAAEPGILAVLGSTDPQVFSAGADLTISDAERAVVSDLVYDCCQTIVTRPGPVIAVITGAAVGRGAPPAAAAGFRVARPGARPPGVVAPKPPRPDPAAG